MFFAVIDERQKESLPEHETQLSSIRWHLSEGLYIFSTFYVSLGQFHFDFTIFSKEKWELFQMYLRSECTHMHTKLPLKYFVAGISYSNGRFLLLSSI